MDQPWLIRTDLLQGPPGPCSLLSGGASWTPVFSGGVASHTFAVANSIVGQSVCLGFDQALIGSGFVVVPYGAVTAAGTVTVYLVLVSGSAPTLTAMNVRIDILRHAGE